MPFGSGTTARANDTLRVLEEKILTATNTITGVSVSGVTGVFSSAVDPNGSVSATGSAICLGTGAMDGFWWRKTTAGTSNSEWVAM